MTNKNVTVQFSKSSIDWKYDCGLFIVVVQRTSNNEKLNKIHNIL